MHNFKAGDDAILVSVEPHWAVPAGTKAKIQEAFSGAAGPGYLVELSTKPGSRIYYAEHRLSPVDDPLPPAPESVRYYNSYIVGRNDQHLILDGHNDNHPGMNLMYLGIVPRTGSTRATKEIGINMDADTALQLAHDLRRMAMEVKRKEKQND